MDQVTFRRDRPSPQWEPNRASYEEQHHDYNNFWPPHHPYPETETFPQYWSEPNHYPDNNSFQDPYLTTHNDYQNSISQPSWSEPDLYHTFQSFYRPEYLYGDPIPLTHSSLSDPSEYKHYLRCNVRVMNYNLSVLRKSPSITDSELRQLEDLSNQVRLFVQDWLDGKITSFPCFYSNPSIPQTEVSMQIDFGHEDYGMTEDVEEPKREVMVELLRFESSFEFVRDEEERKIGEWTSEMENELPPSTLEPISTLPFEVDLHEPNEEDSEDEGYERLKEWILKHSATFDIYMENIRRVEEEISMEIEENLEISLGIENILNEIPFPLEPHPKEPNDIVLRDDLEGEVVMEEIGNEITLGNSLRVESGIEDGESTQTSELLEVSVGKEEEKIDAIEVILNDDVSVPLGKDYFGNEFMVEEKIEEKAWFWDEFLTGEEGDTAESRGQIGQVDETSLPIAELRFVLYGRWKDKHVEPG